LKLYSTPAPRLAAEAGRGVLSSVKNVAPPGMIVTTTVPAPALSLGERLIGARLTTTANMTAIQRFMTASCVV
jgi:hypothetical protein